MGFGEVVVEANLHDTHDSCDEQVKFQART